MRPRNDKFCGTRTRRGRALALSAFLGLAGLGGCSTLENGTITRGYVFDEQTLSQVKIGAPAEQVLSILGSPTTTSTIGGDAWYYISQKVEQPLPAMPARVTDQHVYAVYFDKAKRLTRVANYGMDDGRIVDFSTRQTVTIGGESRLIASLMKQVSGLKYKMF